MGPVATPETPVVPAVAAPAATPTTPVAAPAAPVAQTVISLTPEEFTRLREAEIKLQNIELQAKQQVEDKERERLIALGEQGKAREALTELEGRYKNETTDLRDKYHRTLLTNDIARATLSIGWVSSEAAKQANSLLASEFEVVDVNGSTIVRHKATGKPASEVIPNLIASSEYTHFQKPTTTGGTGQAAADRTSTTVETKSQPRNLGELLIEQAKATRANAPVQMGINRTIAPKSFAN